MHPMFKIEIPKRSNNCVKGGEKLVPGMEYYSLLLDDDSQKLIRQDFCPNCWQDSSTHTDQANTRGHWQSRVDPKQEKSTTQKLDRIEKALFLLKESQNQPDHNEAEIFVLALFLAHAKQLILRKEVVDKGNQYSLYEIANQDEFLTIKKMKLSSLEVGSLQQSISKKLCKET